MPPLSAGAILWLEPEDGAGVHPVVIIRLLPDGRAIVFAGMSTPGRDLRSIKIQPQRRLTSTARTGLAKATYFYEGAVYVVSPSLPVGTVKRMPIEVFNELRALAYESALAKIPADMRAQILAEGGAGPLATKTTPT